MQFGEGESKLWEGKSIGKSHFVKVGFRLYKHILFRLLSHILSELLNDEQWLNTGLNSALKETRIILRLKLLIVITVIRVVWERIQYMARLHMKWYEERLRDTKQITRDTWALFPIWRTSKALHISTPSCVAKNENAIRQCLYRGRLLGGGGGECSCKGKRSKCSTSTDTAYVYIAVNKK